MEETTAAGAEDVQASTGRAPRPPIVKGWPIFGNVFDMASDPAAFFVRSYQEHGPIFRMRIFGRPMTVLAGPKANLFIARDGSRHLRSKEFWQGLVDEFEAKRSLINTDGEFHARLRKVMKRGFGKAQMEGRHSEIIAITDRMIDADWSVGETVPVVDAMQRMAAEQLGILAAGRAPGEYVDDLRVFIRDLLNVLVTRQRPRFFLRSPAYRRAKQRVFALGNEMVRSYDPARVDPERPTLIDDIMRANAEDPTLFQGGELMLAVLGPYFAGLDTVANMTSAMLYAILKHPEIHARVMPEIDAAFAAGPLTTASLKAMPALHATVMETLRRYPIAVAAMRNATQDFEFAGHAVNADEQLFVAVTVSHFLPEFYPDPLRFDIDRFAPPRSEHKRPGAFAPFSLGDHACLGAGLAEVQILLTLATLLHRLELRLTPEDYALRIKVAPTPGPEAAFRVRVVGRRS